MVKPKYLPEPTKCQNVSCGAVFLPKREWQKFCDVSCRRQAWLNKRNQLNTSVLAKIKVLAEEIQETCKELMKKRET